jgi:peptidoglycan/xylan/chitin deacetylase (PgdA/CDA1 family)
MNNSPSQTDRQVLTIIRAAAAGALIGHLLPGVVAWRSMRCRLLPRLSGVGDRAHVALTFDDGPDPVSTPLMLDALEALGWHATFFCLGSQVRRSPGLTEELVSRGHELAVHGDSHVSHLRRPLTSTVPDLIRARDTIEEVGGASVRWFRPPYGAVSSATLVAAWRAGLQLVLWTTWGLDWQPRATGRSVAAHVRRTYYPGATVLLHDSDITSTPGSWRSTLAALPILAEVWTAAGLRVGTLSEHGVSRSSGETPGPAVPAGVGVAASPGGPVEPNGPIDRSGRAAPHLTPGPHLLAGPTTTAGPAVW